MKKNKTLLVDSQFLLKLAFHGDKDTYTKEYGHIGALKTFFNIIRRLIKDYQINKVMLFWDGEHSGILRYNIYPDYKSKRKDFKNSGIILTDKDVKREENAEVSMMKSRVTIKQYAEEFFFRQFEDPNCEADDCIAYYCNNLIADDESVLIFTNDHDFLQLIADNVYVYIHNLKSVVSPANYFLYFDTRQENSELIKAVEGCSSDEVHGVAGIAEKTLMEHFPELKTRPMTFNEMYDRAIEINKGRKKPYSALVNLIEGWTTKERKAEAEAIKKGKEHVRVITDGKQLYNINHKLVNLKEPFMTEEAIENLEAHALSPIDSTNRGGKNILKMMYADGWIKEIPGGPDKYAEYLMELLPVVKREKEIYAYYLASEKN